MKKIQPGDKITIQKSFNDNDVQSFSLLSGDKNPIHFDEEYCKNTIFKSKIVPGFLTCSIFSGLIGNELEGAIYLSQTLNFTNPVFINEKLEYTVEIINIREDKPIFTLKTTCKKLNGEVVIDGQAVVKY